MDTNRRDAAVSSVRGSSSRRLAGVVVPRRVLGALTLLPPEADTLQAGLMVIARRLAVGADARSLALADDLVGLVSRALTRAPIDQGAFAFRLFITCAPFFDRIGRPDVPLGLARQVVACAATWPGLRARRCAHQFAAVVHLQVDDARHAWIHAEHAYDLSTRFEASAGRLETLTLVVSILDNMGLLGDARTLALQLLDFPDVDRSLDPLRLVNAVNGLSLCLRLDDPSCGSRFHEAATAKAASRTASRIDWTSARFEALSALHLVRMGSARSAARHLDEALSRLTKDDEPRIEAVLRTAQVEVYCMLDDPVRMDSSVQRLKVLLTAFDPASAVHRELLRTIIRFQLRRAGDATDVAMRYLELLRERPSAEPGESLHSVDVLLQRLLESIGDDVGEASAEPDARIFQEVSTREWAKDHWRGRRFADFGFRLPDAEPEAVVLTAPEREATLRSAAYETAENWAVVAEIAIGGDGRQCFKVGRVAAGLAAALGLSEERTVLVELACRLRNIGDATIENEETRLKAHAGNRSVGIDEHTQAGARILSFSSDPVLRSAVRVAMNHHAWWNGSGHPGGLCGAAIPIEARICAVADQLVSLVDPIDGRKPWPIEHAIAQLRCMAGVQLDPELVDVLSRVLHDETMRVEDPALRLDAGSWSDPFTRARKQLIETLESAV